MTRHLTRTLIIGIAAATSAVACTLTQRDQADSPVRPRALIYFENRSIDQTAVYVVREGIDEVRIGTVLAGRTDTLIVPPDMAIGNSIRIIARPLAGSFVRSSGPLTLRPGDAMVVRMPTDERTLVVLPP